MTTRPQQVINMSWSKVNKKYSKPFKWWFHKILCEIWWFFGDRGKHYYYHLNKICETGFNLYGEKI